MTSPVTLSRARALARNSPPPPPFFFRAQSRKREIMLLPRSSCLFMLSLCKTRRTTVMWSARAETDKDPGEGRKEGGEGAKRRFSSSPIPIVVNKPNQSGSSGDNGIECGNKKKRKVQTSLQSGTTQYQHQARRERPIWATNNRRRFCFQKAVRKNRKTSKVLGISLHRERQMRIRNFKTPNERLTSTLSRNRPIFAHRSFRV